MENSTTLRCFNGPFYNHDIHLSTDKTLTFTAKGRKGYYQQSSIDPDIAVWVDA